VVRTGVPQLGQNAASAGTSFPHFRQNMIPPPAALSVP